MTISKIAMSILFGASLLASGCTVHHYHHYGPSKRAHKAKDGKKGMRAHKNCSCSHALPEGHPPVGHGMNPHHRMDPHHGKKGQGMDPHHGAHGAGSHEGAGDTVNPFAGAEVDGHHESAEHEGMQAMPAPVQSFHDAFSAVWHLESDDERKTQACAEIASWKKLAVPVKAHRLVGAGAAAYASAAADLVAKVNAAGSACKRKKGDVQAALKDTHDSLHAVFEAVQMSRLN